MDPTLNTDSTNKESDIPNTENKGPNPDNKVPLATFVASVAQQQFNKEREKLEAELTHKIEEQFKAKYAHLIKPGSENLADSRSRRRTSHHHIRSLRFAKMAKPPTRSKSHGLRPPKQQKTATTKEGQRNLIIKMATKNFTMKMKKTNMIWMIR